MYPYGSDYYGQPLAPPYFDYPTNPPSVGSVSSNGSSSQGAVSTPMMAPYIPGQPNESVIPPQEAMAMAPDQNQAQAMGPPNGPPFAPMASSHHSGQYGIGFQDPQWQTAQWHAPAKVPAPVHHVPHTAPPMNNYYNNQNGDGQVHYPWPPHFHHQPQPYGPPYNAHTYALMLDFIQMTQQAAVQQKAGKRQNIYPSERKRRCTYTQHQVDALTARFNKNNKIRKEERQELAKSLKMTEKQINAWFNTRRCQLKRSATEKAVIGEEVEKEMMKDLHGMLNGMMDEEVPEFLDLGEALYNTPL